MKFFKILCLFALFSQMAFADTKSAMRVSEKRFFPPSKNESFDSCNFIAKSHNESQPFARSARFVDNAGEWYSITAPLYPDFASFSSMRNKGFTKGKIDLSNKGVEIKELGDYWVSFRAVVLNPNVEVTGQVLLILVKNGDFNLDNKLANIFGDDVNVTSSESPITIQGSGILKGLKRGEKLSLRTSAVSGVEIVLNVVSWDMSIYKLDS